jgi:hypothetical protein
MGPDPNDLPAGYPNGWMSATDLRVLYNTAYRSQGPILEVGPWLGRSTTAITSALRDRKKNGLDHPFFDTVDYGITSAEEWEFRFNERLKPEKDKGRVMDAVYHPGGTVAVLINNLKANSLLPFVTNIIRGNFLECPIQRKYKMIFCDATHDDQEVHDNVPALAKVAAKNCVYVFDDVVSQQRVDLIFEYIKPKKHFMTRSVFSNPKKRCKLLVVET